MIIALCLLAWLLLSLPLGVLVDKVIALGNTNDLEV